MSFVLALALLACSASKDDTGAGSDTASGEHPVAPEEYADSWDVDSLGCEDATLYWAFSGTIDDAGRLSGEETWYWFFPDEGYASDCADTFDLDAAEGATPVADDPCLSCDRDFSGSYVQDADKVGCSWDGYEQLLDNDDTDRIDEEEYTLALMLDTDPLGGEEGDVNVWSFAQDDRDADTWIDRAMSIGTFVPDTAGDVDGPGTLTWARQDGLCITITEGED